MFGLCTTSICQELSIKTKVPLESQDDESSSVMVLLLRQLNAETKELDFGKGEVLIFRFRNEVVDWEHFSQIGEVTSGTIELLEKNGTALFRELQLVTNDKQLVTQPINYPGYDVPAYQLFGPTVPKWKLDVYFGTQRIELKSWEDVNRLTLNNGFRYVCEKIMKRRQRRRETLFFSELIPLVYGHERNVRMNFAPSPK